MTRRVFLAAYTALYERLLRPLIFRKDAQQSHEVALRLMRSLDRNEAALAMLRGVRKVAARSRKVEVGGVTLDSQLILAAGWVKGDGFESEREALDAVLAGRNIIPGWRTMPALVGPVEFGSFTRWPRMGNTGVVLWRDVATRSTQNRIGLKNPGVEAAAEFLARRREGLPERYGINIAVSPGVTEVEQREVLESVEAFARRGVYPSWFTLNLSCPNTEDGPGGNQTEEKAVTLCGSMIERLGDTGHNIPLWVKLGPTLAIEQYQRLMRAFAQVGVRAVVATNTMPEPTPDDPGAAAGVGGGRLNGKAVAVACELVRENVQYGYGIDVIGCGGVLDSQSFSAFARQGVTVVQYLSALIYRGPLAAAVIENEAHDG